MNKSIFNKNGFVKRPNPKAKTKFTTHTLDPRLPEFIRLHPIFKHHPIEKKFEEHGLSDFTIKIPDTSLSVIFSTSPFDIATMSMRGTTSCMRWGNPNASSLVGSIIDPYCGLIFITDGSQVSLSDKRDDWHFKQAAPKASKILARSVVRIVRSVKGKKQPFIGIERVYGTTDLGALEPKLQERAQTRKIDTLSYFMGTIGNRSKDEDKTVALIQQSQYLYTIPSSDPIDELHYYDIRQHGTENKGWLSYRDSYVQYECSKAMKDAMVKRQYSLPTDEDDGNE